MKRRILAVLLACLMVLSTVPVVVFAEETNVNHEHVCAGEGNPHTWHVDEGEACEYCVFKKSVAPTCTKFGYDEYECATCHTPIMTNFGTETGDHVYVESKPGKAATCTEAGYTAEMTCTDCGDKQESVVIPAGHTTEVLPGSAATCTTNGLTEGSKCSVCNEILVAQTVIPATGHVWGQYPEEIELAPNCTDTGVAIYKCTGCDLTKEVVIKVNDEHVLTYVEAVDATCSATGNIAYWSCVECGKKFANEDATGEYTDDEVVIAKVDHSWDAGVVTDTPACGYKGTKTYTCGVCGETKTEKIDALECVPQVIPAEAPTCTADGWTEVTVCAVCGNVIDGGSRIPALGHDMVEDTEARVEPTCTEAGSKTEKCSRCGHSETTAIEATGHTGMFVSNKSQPTCTEAGANNMICTVCLVQYEEVIPATGHPADKIITMPGYDATCTVDGLTEGTKCGVCGTVLTAQETITAQGHVYVSTGVVITAPTCTATGVGETKCACGETSTEVLAMVPHTEVAVPGYDATCTEDGLSEGKKCSVCDLVITEQTVIPCTGHTALNTETQSAATCTDNGSKLVYCLNCSYYVHYVYVDANGAPVSSEITENMTDDEIIAAGYVAVDPAKGHSYTVDANGDRVYTYTTEPTCMVAGVRRYDCDACDHYYTVTEDAFVYNPNKTYETLDAAKEIHVGIDEATKHVYRKGTCTIVGLYDYKCADCGNEVLIVMQNTGSGVHSYAEAEAQIDATCTTVGKTAVQTCTNVNSDGTVCGHTIGGEEIPALGHNVTEENFTAQKDPACEVAGQEGYYVCDRCDQYIKADGVTNIESTDANGDGIIDALYIAPLEHQTIVVDKVDATCYSEGAKGATVCTVCGETLTANETIPMIPHTLTDGAAQAPTCTQIGWDAYQHCTVVGCGYTTKVEKAALGHNVIALDSGKPVSCTEYGYTALYGCANGCGDISLEYIDGYVSAIGHSYVKIDAESKDPTCTEDGVIVEGCQNGCGADKIIITVPALGHSNTSGNLTGTCLDTIEDRICANCGEEIPVVGHNYIVKVDLPATCLEDGYKKEVCEHCGDEKVTWYKSATKAHVMGDWVVTTPANMDVAGVETSTCENCDYYETRAYYAADVIYTVDVDNADKAGVGYTDGSIVSVVVKATGITEIGSMFFDLVYDDAALDYVDATVLTDEYATFLFNDNGGKVSVVAHAGGSDSVELNGTVELIVVRFKVNNSTAEAAEFKFENVQALAADAAMTARTHLEETESIAIRGLMDFDGNDKIELVDAEMANKIVTGEAAIDYDVTLDVDKNGAVEAIDFAYIYSYMIGAMTYEELMALRN